MKNVVGIIAANFNNSNFGTLIEERAVASLPFGGRYRLIDFPLSNMANCNITKVGLVMPYKYRSIIDHVSDGSPWSLERKEGGLFILPGSVYGMKNGKSKLILRDLERNMDLLTRETAEYVVVCNCNTLFNMDLQELIDAHVESKKPVTFLYQDKKNNGKCDHYLKVEDGQVKKISSVEEEDSSKFLDCFIINREVLVKMLEWFHPLSHMDIIDVISVQMEVMEINAYKFDGYARVINDIDDYVAACQDLFSKEIYDELFRIDRPIMTKVSDEPPAHYKDGAVVKNAIVSSGCIIEGTVENSILFRSAKVEKGAVVKNSIVMQHGTIEKDAFVSGMISDKYAVIKANSYFESPIEKPFIVEKYKTL